MKRISRWLMTVVSSVALSATADTAFRSGGSTFGLWTGDGNPKKDDYFVRERELSASVLKSHPQTREDTNQVDAAVTRLLREMGAHRRYRVWAEFARDLRLKRSDLLPNRRDELFANEFAATFRQKDEARFAVLRAEFEALPDGSAKFDLFRRLNAALSFMTPKWQEDGSYILRRQLAEGMIRGRRELLDEGRQQELAGIRMSIARARHEYNEAKAVYAEALAFPHPNAMRLKFLRGDLLDLCEANGDFASAIGVLRDAHALDAGERTRLAKFLIGDGRMDEAVKELDGLMEDSKLKADVRFDLSAMKAFAASGSGEDFVRLLGELHPLCSDELTFFRSIRRAIRNCHALVPGEERIDWLKAAVSYSKTLLHDEERLVYDVPCLRDCPHSAGAALRGGLFERLPTENRMGRYQAYYAGRRANEEAIIRSAAKPNLAADGQGKEACVAAAYDATGLHVFIRMNDPEAWKLREGLENRWSVEFEIQPGDGEVSHWLMFNGDGTVNETQLDMEFPHEGYKLGEDFITFDSESEEKWHCVHISVPWILWDGRLPAEGETWRISLIASWADRFGALGGGSVHEVQRGLALRFRMSEADDALIRRGLLRQAVGEYRKVRGKWENAEFWSDPHLGDGAFFGKVVKPYLDATDAVEKKVREGDLSDYEVRQILSQSFFDLSDFRLRLDAKRKVYLQQLLF